MKTRLLLIVLALLALLPASLAQEAGGSLTIGLATEPVSLDPADGLFIAEQFVMMNIYDTLTRIDPDNVLHPGLATDWEFNAEGTEFTFTLRDDVTFHDGTPFNAEAVKSAFDRIAETGDPAATATSILAGYVETVVEDEFTVTALFDTPKPTFINDLSRVWMGIPSPTATAESGDDFNLNPVGSGPFVFESWTTQEQITLTRNEDYAWGAEFAANDGPPLLESVTFRFLPEAATRLTALQTGEVQVAEDPPGQSIQELLDSGYQLVSFSAPGMPSHMMINTEKAPTADVRVRQAMIYAMNQEQLVQVAFNGLNGPAYSVLSPSTFGFNEAAAFLYRYDPDEAARLLDEAGWVDSDGDGVREKDGETLAIVYAASPVWEEAHMELVAAYLGEVGFDVEIMTMDDAGIFEFGVAGNHNILNMSWTSVDPGVLYYVYHSSNIAEGSGFTRFTDAELDAALDAALVELDNDARAGYYQTAQQIIMENALALPLYTYNRSMLLESQIQGWQFDAEGYPLLYEVWLGE